MKAPSGKLDAFPRRRRCSERQDVRGYSVVTSKCCTLFSWAGWHPGVIGEQGVSTCNKLLQSFEVEDSVGLRCSPHHCDGGKALWRDLRYPVVALARRKVAPFPG